MMKLVQQRFLASLLFHQTTVRDVTDSPVPGDRGPSFISSGAYGIRYGVAAFQHGVHAAGRTQIVLFSEYPSDVAHDPGQRIAHDFEFPKEVFTGSTSQVAAAVILSVCRQA
jgi:hypothetical protein